MAKQKRPYDSDVSVAEDVTQTNEVQASLPIKKVSEVDLGRLVIDIAQGTYFPLSENDARKIAEKMISRGASALHDEEWFLSPSERKQFASELAKKHNLK